MTKRKFKGFPPGKFSMTQIPAPFFTDLLPLIDDLAELKVLLFCLQALPQRDGQYPYLCYEDFLEQKTLMDGLAIIAPEQSPQSTLDHALNSAVERETLLRVDVEGQTLYFMNSNLGRTAVGQIKAGEWRVSKGKHIEILPPRPTVYRLYEENIGPLTPMIADDLKDMEQDYSQAWVEEAIRIAVQNNKRSIRYMHAILKRWRTEGKADLETSRRGPEGDGKDYLTGRYAHFFDQ